MNFVSCSYAILFAVVFAARLTVGRNKTEKPYVALLIAASALFYAWHIPVFLLILLATAVVDYYAALYLTRGPGAAAPPGARRWRRTVLVLSLCVNLGLLFYFKYVDFAAGLVGDLLGCVGISVSPIRLEPELPMGISFYTFASLSYTIDVYRGQIDAVRGFARYFLFVAFFPHLVAGPIVRAAQFLPQLDRRRRLRIRVFLEGAFLIIRGFFLKLVCADNLASVVNAHWSAGYQEGADSIRLLLLTGLFAGQIFCDFEGYSSIAQGTAYLLGFRLPTNFNNPYLASSFRNFWERWHITLSQWLRDYLYIPLGGNRGSALRTGLNLMIVMVLGGLWHGANSTFVAWGALHGGALVVERLLGFHLPPAGRRGRLVRTVVWWPVVVGIVLITWILFRCDSFPHARTFIANIGSLRFLAPLSDLAKACLFLAPPAVMHLRGLLVEASLVPPAGPLEKSVLAGAMLFAVVTCYGIGNEFIYFRF